jgi:hypothetical protein
VALGGDEQSRVSGFFGNSPIEPEVRQQGFWRGLATPSVNRSLREAIVYQRCPA